VQGWGQRQRTRDRREGVGARGRVSDRGSGHRGRKTVIRDQGLETGDSRQERGQGTRDSSWAAGKRDRKRERESEEVR